MKMYDNKRKRRRHSKRQNGFSVLYVLSIGLIALMGVMAVTDALVSAQRNVATQVYMNEATSAAENSLQYAIGLINANFATGSLTNITSPIQIPSQITGNANVTVTMTQIPSTQLYSSNLTTPIWNQNSFPSGTSPSSPPVYLLLSAQSQYGTFQRTINVILGQTFIPQNGPPSGSASPPAPPTTPYFTGALFGNQTVVVNGVNVLFENSYNPTAASFAQPVISSNNSIQLSGPTTIAGSLNASSYLVPAIPNNQGVPTPSVMIDGNVSYTGSNNPYTPTSFIIDQGNTSPTLGANVLGDGLAGGLGNQAGAVANNAAQSTTAAPPVQSSSVPATITSTGTVGNQSIVVATPALNSPTEAIGAMTATGSDNITLSSGQYVANSFSTSSSSSLNINLTTNSLGQVQPVQIFLQGNSESGIALQSQGSVNMASATQSASNLQFFYNGTEPIFVTMGAQNPNFYGQIYAPNANVVIDTSGGAFHGSVVANNLTLQGSGTFYYDPRTTSLSGVGPGAASPGYTPASSSNSSNSSNSSTFSLSVLSWQEKTTGAQ
jgi:hypothetical protein